MADQANTEVVRVRDLVNLRAEKGRALTYDEMDYNIDTMAKFLDLVTGNSIVAVQTLLEELDTEVELVSNNYANFVESVASQREAADLEIQDLELRIANTISDLQSTEQDILDTVNEQITATRNFVNTEVVAARTDLREAVNNAVEILSSGVDQRILDAVNTAVVDINDDIADARSYANTLVISASNTLNTAIESTKNTLELAIANSAANVLSQVGDSYVTKTGLETAIATSEEAFSQGLSAIEVRLGNNITTSISSLETTVANTTDGLAETIRVLDTTLRDNVNTQITSTISYVDTAVRGVNNALSQQVSELEASVNNTINTRIGGLLLTLADANSALASSIETIEANLAENYASKTELSTTETTLGNAISTAISTLSATVNTEVTTLSANISTLEQALSDTNTALVQRIGNLEVDISNNISASIDTLEQTLADTNTALVQRISNLEVDISNNISASIDTLEQTLADTNSALVQRISDLEVDISNNISASIDTLEQTLADTNTALAQQITALDSSFSNTVDAEITTLTKSLSDAQSALVESISTLSSTVTNNDIDVNSSIDTLALTLSNAQTAIAQTISDLGANVANNYATKTELSTVETTANTALVNAISELATSVNNDINAVSTSLTSAIATTNSAAIEAINSLSVNVANTYATKTELTNTVANAAEARAEDFNLLTASLGSGVRTLNLNPFMALGYTYWSESSTDFSALDDEAKYKLATADTSYDPATGGEALYVIGQGVAYYRHKLPVDLNRIYKVRFRVKNIGSNNNIIYAGVATYNINGSLETSSPGTHRYCAAGGVEVPNDNVWHVYEGLITGPDGTETSNTFRSTSKFAAPMFIVGYQQNESYKILVDELTFEDVTEQENNEATFIDINSAISTVANSVVTTAQELQANFANTYATKLEVSSVASSANLALSGAVTTLTASINAASQAASSANTAAYTQANNALSSAKTHANTQANNALNSAKAYTDAEVNTAVVTLSASITEVANAIVTTNTALASILTSVESVLGTAQTSVTSLSSTVDGVKGAYGIAVNNNGHISGFSLLSTLAEDSTNATSEFTVAADRFNVVNPNNTDETIAPFAVVTSGGDAGVYVNGAVIKPGSIAANRIAANELSAINANMGTITAGVMRNSADTFIIDLNAGTITIKA
jgi:hypothetical protein